MESNQSTPGNCPKCGSADTKFIAVKPPKVKKRGGEEGKTAHRCTSECEQASRFCTACRLATPLPVAEIPGQRLPESESMQKA